MFFCEFSQNFCEFFCEISKNTFFTEHLWTTASNYFNQLIRMNLRKFKQIAHMKNGSTNGANTKILLITVSFVASCIVFLEVWKLAQMCHFELVHSGSFSKLGRNSSFEEKVFKCDWDLQISLITVSHMASCNLQNFGPHLSLFCKTLLFREIWQISLISTSNYMFGRAIWDKLPKCILENFEIVRVKRGQFQNVHKSGRWVIPKIARTRHVITG